ncbi:hypothetical protein RMATCC62417_14789 [Rhizopus microsporus]|nr:hypothetical protein RMATCC62417_14789 [Rhizopus microsporus]
MTVYNVCSYLLYKNENTTIDTLLYLVPAYLYLRPKATKKKKNFLLLPANIKMDFTSVPFQELLVRNAEDKQLLNFLSHLDKQYTEAQDEKVRFGTLQILIPVYKAYLNRLQDINEGNRVLEAYLKPWILTSLSHESTVSTESVHLLENTVAFFIVKSFLTGYQFGKDTILMLISQLVSIMTIEPDFVDLKPIEFIETCVDKLECSEQWQQVQQHKDNSIELECCLNILSYFIRDLNENEQLKAMGANDMDHWIELIFSIATAMIPCTDATVRSKLAHDLLPNLFRWKQHNKDFGKQIYWCEASTMA